MGNRNSRAEDDNWLIDPEDEETQNFPLFKELNLVIIGTHCAGKNEVGNAILQKKVFKVWGKFCNSYIKKGEEVRNRKVKVIRAPGWKGDLHASVKQQIKTKQQIVYSVQSNFSKGPHAVLLALDVSSTITDTTKETLESLLTEEVWDHTVVMFTHGEKLKGITIKDQIRVNQLDRFIERCGKRYCVLEKNGTRGNQNLELVDMIEYFIADKDAPVEFCLDREGAKTNDLTEKKSMTERLKEKIDKLNAFTNRLSSNANHDAYQQLLDSKDAEIRRLQAILQKREKEIQKLEAQLAQAQNANMHHPDLASSRCVTCERKDEEIRLLREEVSRLKDEMTIGNMVVAQSPDRRRFLELNSIGCPHGTPPLPCNSYEMQRLPPADSFHGWAQCLNNIMDELTAEQFKKLKNLLENLDKSPAGECRRIPAGLLEGKDKASLPKFLIQTWGSQQCIINMRDIMKKIPRNDEAMQDLFLPFLSKLQETW